MPSEQQDIGKKEAYLTFLRAFPGLGMPYFGTTAPDGWLLCDGSAISRTTYAALFGIIGTTFGVGDGSTTFNVPDMRGRTAVALDNMGGSSANRITGAWADSLGGADGEETHTLTEAEIAAHTHDMAYTAATNTTATGGFTRVTGLGSGLNIGASASAGGGGAHNNVQPSIALNFIIKT